MNRGAPANISVRGVSVLPVSRVSPTVVIDRGAAVNLITEAGIPITVAAILKSLAGPGFGWKGQ
jgi:hypothetical protein